MHVERLDAFAAGSVAEARHNLSGRTGLVDEGWFARFNRLWDVGIDAGWSGIGAVGAGDDSLSRDDHRFERPAGQQRVRSAGVNWRRADERDGRGHDEEPATAMPG